MAKAKRTTKTVAPKSKRVAGAKKGVRKSKAKTIAKRASSATTSSVAQANVNDIMHNAAKAMNLDASMMNDFISSGAVEAQKAQDKMMAISRESAEQLAQSAEAASRSLNDAMALSKENVDACMKCSNIAMSVSKSVGTEVFSYANKSFSKNVELSKEIMACRTLNDMFDLQSKFMKQNMDSLFSESVKLSELMFKGAAEASQPISEYVAGSAQRIKDTVAA